MTIAAGVRLGPYEILSPLGAGGMGEVYRARDARLGREVAVKVLPAELASDAGRLRRFENEARAASALNHPNIVTIYDIGTSDSRSYMAMEMVAGKTLRELLFAGPLGVKRLVQIAVQIAEGLARAHEAGIIHRDLKPENVMVTNEGLVKVLDFGLAKLTSSEDESGEETSLPTRTGTSPGVVLGTVGYMSPEQVLGKPLDARSDLFSLGTILYEMFSGKRPFHKKSPPETMAAILNEELSELSATNEAVSPSLDRIVRHCLEKEPSNRFQSARDVAFALSEVSGAATVGSGAQAAVPAAGKSRILIAAAVIAILAVAGVLLLRRSPRGAGEATRALERVVVLPFENVGAAEDDYFADGMTDEVRGKLTSLQGLEVIARDSSTPYKETAKTSQQIARELDAKYLLKATVRWQKSGGAGRVQVRPELIEVKESGAPRSRWQQSFDAPLTDVFQVQGDIASRVAEALGVAIGVAEEKRIGERPTQNLAAYDAFLKGEEASKAPGFDAPRRALPFYEQAVALDPGFAQAWAAVSRCTSRLYGLTPSPEMAQRARDTAEKAVALSPNRPEGYIALASVVEDPSQALEECARGLRNVPGDAGLLFATGSVEIALGRWDAAVEHLKQANRVDPRSGLGMLGRALLFLRRYPEARGALNRHLALHPKDLWAINLKAITYLGDGDLAGARAVVKAASMEMEPTALVASVAFMYDLAWLLDEGQRELLLRLEPSAFGDSKAFWAYSLMQVHVLRGDAANVRAYAEETRKASEEQLRATPGRGQHRALLALSLAYLGRKEEAIREGLQAVALYPVAKDADVGSNIQYLLARIYMLAGEPEAAIDRLEPLIRKPSYFSRGWLELDPNLDPLRKNPRFQRLVAGK